MKKIVSILSTVVLVAASCQKPVEPSLSLKDQEISAPAAGLEQTVTFQTNQDWSATPDAGWVTVTPASGSAADSSATITVSVVKNDTFDARTAKVSVKAGPLSATITVNQAGKDVVFTISDQQLNAEAAGLEKTIEFESNIDWTASSDASWLTVTPASGKASDAKVSITIKAEKNTLAKTRNAKVSVSAGSKSAVITVNQEAAPAYVKVTPASDKPFGYSGLETSISVESNAAWTVSCDAGWLEVSPSNGEGNGTVNVKAGMNEGNDKRIAKLVFTAADATAEVTVEQKGKETDGDNESFDPLPGYEW